MDIKGKSRRRFLKQSLGAATGLAAATTESDVIAGGPPQTDVGKLTLKDFSKRTGETFRIQLPTYLLSAKLSDTKDLTASSTCAKHPRPRKFRAPFRIELSTQMYGAMKSGTYTVQHTQLGTFNLLLTSVGSQMQAFKYDAVFG